MLYKGLKHHTVIDKYEYPVFYYGIFRRLWNYLMYHPQPITKSTYHEMLSSYIITTREYVNVLKLKYYNNLACQYAYERSYQNTDFCNYCPFRNQLGNISNGCSVKYFNMWNTLIPKYLTYNKYIGLTEAQLADANMLDLQYFVELSELKNQLKQIAKWVLKLKLRKRVPIINDDITPFKKYEILGV